MIQSNPVSTSVLAGFHYIEKMKNRPVRAGASDVNPCASPNGRLEAPTEAMRTEDVAERAEHLVAEGRVVVLVGVTDKHVGDPQECDQFLAEVLDLGVDGAADGASQSLEVVLKCGLDLIVDPLAVLFGDAAQVLLTVVSGGPLEDAPLGVGDDDLDRFLGRGDRIGGGRVGIGASHNSSLLVDGRVMTFYHKSDNKSIYSRGHGILSFMIADITITEKSFGPKILMTGVKFSVDDGEKVGIIGRNGIGKSTLFGILTGQDTDFTGEIVYKRNSVVVSTAQEHHNLGTITVLEYILAGVPEYAELKHILQTYPETMGDDMKKIHEYTEALDRFGQKNFYQIEEVVSEELKNFQIDGVDDRQFATLSGGQKRLIEVVKIMHSDADMALVDEPTNHMDYIAKGQFIDWMSSAREAMLVITHDRDVLRQVDRIIELRDGSAVSFKGNYDAYLKQNAVSTGTAMNEFEMIEKRMANLKVKIIDYKRLKEKARNPATIQKFKRLENISREELAELDAKERPTFWIDKDSVDDLNYKTAAQYQKFKARNIRLKMHNDESRSKHKLVEAKDVALGYGDTPLFEGVNIDLREGEAVELRGRNGAGKTTLIKQLLLSGHAAASASPITLFNGTIVLDTKTRIGIYEQEVDTRYFELPLGVAIERMYLDRGLTISDTKIRQLLSDYLFNDGDLQVPLSRLSGGQKARFQLIAMLANEPQLLILDEPTNHLDLPSIEELESALSGYTGAILYVSHDNYFREKIGGDVVQVG